VNGKRRRAAFLQSPLPDSNRRPLLTMRSKRLAVAAGGNGLALFKPLSGVQRAERLPRVAPPLFHNCSIPKRPKRAVLMADHRPESAVDPSRRARVDAHERHSLAAQTVNEEKPSGSSPQVVAWRWRPIRVRASLYLIASDAGHPPQYVVSTRCSNAFVTTAEGGESLTITTIWRVASLRE
jgi:hypothetical protein